MNQIEQFSYDNKSVRNFALASAFWGVIGMTVGLWAALQLVFPSLNFATAEVTFGRIRPLHTNAVIFAFVLVMFFSPISNNINHTIQSFFKKVAGKSTPDSNIVLIHITKNDIEKYRSDQFHHSDFPGGRLSA